jgi:hypothetical protein
LLNIPTYLSLLFFITLHIPTYLYLFFFTTMYIPILKQEKYCYLQIQVKYFLKRQMNEHFNYFYILFADIFYHIQILQIFYIFYSFPIIKC